MHHVKNARKVIRFLNSVCVKPADYWQNATAIWKRCLNSSTIYKWIHGFTNRRNSLQWKGRPLPSTSKNNDNIETTGQIDYDNQRVRIDEVPNKLDISHSSAFSTIHKSGKLSGDVTLLHDNARYHSVDRTGLSFHNPFVFVLSCTTCLLYTSRCV